MPDEREAIIEAMHAAMVDAGDKLHPHIKVWPLDATVLARFVDAAYDASPIERYRKALEEIREATWRLLPTSTPKPNGRADAISHAFTIANDALRGDD